MHEQRGQTRDEGAALVMAIAFVTVIGLLLAIALSYSSVSMKAASTKYVPARDRLYSADMANKAAMLYVAAHPDTGQSLPGVTCNTTTNVASVRGQSVDVQVCPQGVGAAGSFPTAGSVRWGLVTLATGSTKGLTMTGNNSFQINGNVYSNTELNVGGSGSLVVKQGSLYAGSCTGSGTITVDGLKDCAATGAGTAKDPGYVPGITAAPAAATIDKACGTSGTAATRVVEIGPGKWSAATLTAAKGCANVWLKPGIHYLEGLGSWSITNKVVAGDTATGTSSGIAAASVPGGCDDTKDGAMLYLAGDTTITMAAFASPATSSSLQVCGKNVAQTSGRTVRIPLYDSTADAAGSTSSDTLTGSATSQVDDDCSSGGGPSRVVHDTHRTADSGGSNCWQAPNNARTVDGSVSHYAGLTKGNSTSNITVQGFTGSTTIPSTLRTLTVNVTAVSTLTSSGKNGTDGSASYVVKIVNSDGNTACTSSSQTMAVGSSLPGTPDTFNVTCTRSLTTPLRVRFQATAGSADGTRMIKFDGATLGWSVTVAGTLLKHNSGLTSLTSTAGGFVWFGGEIYLPASSLSLTASKLNGALSTLGAVVRSLTYNADSSTVDVQGTANNAYTGGGDVVVKTKVGANDWVTCRIAYVLDSGKTTGTPTLKGCTVPR